MNNIVFINFLRFFTLLLAQALVFSHINFLGYINPQIYILFVLIYPVANNRIMFILVSFFLGLFLDMFLDTGGIHAAATVLLAYIRPVLLKFSFGAAYEYQAIKFDSTEVYQRLTYFVFAIVLHHFVVFGLEIFDGSKINYIFRLSILSSLFTLILAIPLTALISRPNNA